MSKRFGKKRGPKCKCEHDFTCRACLVDGILTVPAVHAPRIDTKYMRTS